MRKVIGATVALAIVISLVLMPAAVFAALGKDCKWDNVKWEKNPNSWKLYLAHWGRTPTNAMTGLAGLCGPDALCAAKCYDGATRKLNTGNMLKGCNPGGEVGLAESSYTCKTCNVETGSAGSCPGENCEFKAGLGYKEKCAEGCVNAGVCRTDVSANRCVMSTKEIYTAKCNGCWGVSTMMANTSWQNSYLGSPARLNDKHMNHRGVEETTFGGDWGVTGSNHPECASKIWAMQCNMKVGRTADDPVTRNCGYGKPCLEACTVK